MYVKEISNSVSMTKDKTIADGQQMVDIDDALLEQPQLDGNGDPILDAYGDPLMEPVLNETGDDVVVQIYKTAQEVSDDEDALKASKTAEIQAKIDTYEAAQQYQIDNGGPGPVADFETMKIVNEHASSFSVEFKA